MNQPNRKHLDKVILLFLFALFLLASPLSHIWSGKHAAWYAPYLVWAGLIGLAFWLQRKRDRE